MVDDKLNIMLLIFKQLSSQTFYDRKDEAV